MKWMQLNAVYAGLYHLLQRLQALALRLARQPDDKVATHLQPALARQTGRTLIAGKIVPAINPVQRFIVRGL
jgi:hypothetical protein